jgi:NinB protein
MTHSATFQDWPSAHAWIQRLAAWAKGNTLQGRPVTIKASNAKRTLDQNALFHAICDDLAKARVQWAGKPRTAAQWKQLLVSGHAVATQADADIVPGLEGEFLNLRESTADMSKARKSSLIDYAQAFAASALETR